MGKTSNKSIRKVDATAAVVPKKGEMKRIKKEVIFLPAKLQETLHISEGKKKKEEICSSEYSSSQKPGTLLATPQSTGSNTVFFSSLNLHAGHNDLIDFFKDAGKIVDICFICHENGQSMGFGHIEFATSEGAQKALQLNGAIMLHRVVRLGTSPDWRVRWSYPCGIFVRGFDHSHGEEESRRALAQHFGSCGVISSVTAFASASSSVSGIAYVKFKDVLSVDKALELNGSELGERYLTVEEARIGGGDCEGSGSGIGGLWNSSHQFCRGDGRFCSRRLFWRCGRGRETPNKPNHRCS